MGRRGAGAGAALLHRQPPRRGDLLGRAMLTFALPITAITLGVLAIRALRRQ